MVEWYLYVFTTEDVFEVLSRHKKQEEACPDLATNGRMGLVKLVGKDQMRASTEKLQRESNIAAAKVRRRWNRAAKSKKKNAVVRSGENVHVA